MDRIDSAEEDSAINVAWFGQLVELGLAPSRPAFWLVLALLWAVHRTKKRATPWHARCWLAPGVPLAEDVDDVSGNEL